MSVYRTDSSSSAESQKCLSAVGDKKRLTLRNRGSLSTQRARISKRSLSAVDFLCGTVRRGGGWRDVGQDDVSARFTMGTTTALSRQAVINGAVIKPAKHEADGFRWLEG